MRIEKSIQEKACELGYEQCGIIAVPDLDGFGERLSERIERVPESKSFYKSQRRLTQLGELYPWANSVVVAVSRYGHYRLPEQIRDHIGKHYVFDSRINEESAEFKRSAAMEQFLSDLGLRAASNRKFGAVGMRYAAMKAGLGVIRRNNFFYTDSGSWVLIEAWLVDRDMKLLGSCAPPPCPKGCSSCIKACPTGSLSSAYTMNPVSCVSYLTTFGDHDFTANPLGKRCAGWIYGCDACQDACPANSGKWAEEDDFPGASELSPHLTPESIMKMDGEFYRRCIQPKFFYISPDELWKWKINALNFMRNNYRDDYRPYILEACDNGDEKIRSIAKVICGELYA
jgi:epoxyqueuosine reductase